MINTENDIVQIYEDKQGEWRWRRVDYGNGRIVSNCGQGYVDEAYCLESAGAYNPGVKVIVL